MSYRKVLENLRNLKDKRLTGGMIWYDVINCGCVLGAALPGLKEHAEGNSIPAYIKSHYDAGFNNLEGMTIHEAIVLERTNDFFYDKLMKQHVPEKQNQVRLYEMVLAWLEAEVARESNVVQ